MHRAHHCHFIIIYYSAATVLGLHRSTKGRGTLRLHVRFALHAAVSQSVCQK